MSQNNRGYEDASRIRRVGTSEFVILKGGCQSVMKSRSTQPNFEAKGKERSLTKNYLRELIERSSPYLEKECYPFLQVTGEAQSREGITLMPMKKEERQFLG